MPAKMTPGPWNWDGADYPFVINDSADRVIAMIPDPADQVDPGLRVADADAEANARAIVAVPELIDVLRRTHAALQDARVRFTPDGEYPEEWDRAEDAAYQLLARITGD